MTDQDPVAWLRKAINQRLYLARRPMELGSAAEWTELSSGVLMTVAPNAPQEGWDGVHPLGDSTVTRLMEANDPQDTIARCEAELAILAMHSPTRPHPEFGFTYPAAAKFCGYCGPGDNWQAEQEPDHYPFALWPCSHVRLLASGYKHWSGYEEDAWKADA